MKEQVDAAQADEPDEWSDDLLNRKADADFVQRYLVSRVGQSRRSDQKASYVLNIDAGWGEGKTFFLSRLREQLERDNHLVVYVNAWEDDHADDPLISVIAAIDQALGPHLRARAAVRRAWDVTRRSGLQIAASVGRSAAKTLAKKVLGDGVDEIAEQIADPSGDDSMLNNIASEAGSEVIDRLFDKYAEDALRSFERHKRSTARFKSNLEKTLSQLFSGKKLNEPLFVLCDELDRCRPTYAVSFLERIKHLVQVDGVVFVVATDTSQLRHSVSTIYGANFAAAKYLSRFFDRSYVFSRPDKKGFALSKLQDGINFDVTRSPSGIEAADLCATILSHSRLPLRDIERAIDILRTVTSVWDKKAKIELIYFLALVVAFQANEIDKFDLLESGSKSPDMSFMDDFSLELDKGGWERGVERQDYSDCVVRFVLTMRKPLPEVSSSDSGSPWQHYVDGAFHEELALEHHNRFRRGSEPMSVMRQYASFIRNAGRVEL